MGGAAPAGACAVRTTRGGAVEMAAVSAAELLQRSEALVDGKKINEAIDILNGLGIYLAISNGSAASVCVRL